MNKDKVGVIVFNITVGWLLIPIIFLGFISWYLLTLVILLAGAPFRAAQMVMDDLEKHLDEK